MTDQNYKLVPVRPAVEMIEAAKGRAEDFIRWLEVNQADWADIVKEAIAAAPEPVCRFTRWDDGSYTPGCDQNQYVGRALRYCPHCGKKVEVAEDD